MLIVLITIALGLLGLLLLAFGVRGRRINDHPICRGCGFDVTGIANEGVCPECGRGLGEAGSIRVGQRERRPRLIVAGVAILLFVAPAPLVFRSGNETLVAAHLPGAWLPRLGELLPKTWADAFEAELLTRHAAGTLSDRATLAAARASLRSIHRDRTKWSVNTGDLIEAAFDKRLLSDQEAAAFLAEVYAFRIDFAPPLTPGQISWIVWMDHDLGWVPQFGGRFANTATTVEAIALTLDGQPHTLTPTDFTQVLFHSRERGVPLNGGGSIGILQGVTVVPEIDGSGTAKLQLRVRFDESLAPDKRPKEPSSFTMHQVAKPLAEPSGKDFLSIRELSLEGPVTLIAAPVDAIEHVTDDATTEKLLSMITLPVRVSSPMESGERGVQVMGSRPIDGIPVAIIARLSLYSGDRFLGQSAVVTIAIPQPRTSGMYLPPDPTYWRIPGDVDPKTLRFRLVPVSPIEHARYAVEGAVRQRTKLKVYGKALEPKLDLQIWENDTPAAK